jgi:hypothetical protein
MSFLNHYIVNSMKRIFPKIAFLLCGAAIFPVSSLLAQDSVKGSAGDNPSESLVARGTVFHDVNGNGKLDNGDPLFSGVRVSNGQDIVKTDERGRYELPIDEDSIVFIIKPNGFRTAIGKNNLPKFYYIHKPNGSPKIRFQGVAPTGHLPQSIDFPLYRQSEPETFRIILFGDPQPRNKTEVDYISQDVVSELVGDSSAFGVTLGDIAFDNLDTLEPLNQSIALIGIPWYNVIGNHDINLDVENRQHINETFESLYGPSYYSFDYGQVHFVVLDNIDWESPNERIDRFHYTPNFGTKQLEFLRKDLELIPETQMVVLLMHVPIMGTNDKLEFFRLIEDRPFCVSISAHRHFHRHTFLGKDDGFNGSQKHHHIVNVTVSGSWWSGLKNDNGIPHTTMADGAPNGYSYMTFSRDRYQLDFKVAGRPATYQMNIQFPQEISAKEMDETEIVVNVFNGSEKSTVDFSLDDDANWRSLEKVERLDPHYVELVKREEGMTPPVEPKLTRPKTSYHLWAGNLSESLEPGTHLLRVRTTDMHGRTYFGHRSFRVVQ